MKNRLSYRHGDDQMAQGAEDLSWQQLEAYLDRMKTEKGYLAFFVGGNKLDLTAENGLFVFTEGSVVAEGYLARFYLHPEVEAFGKKYGNPNRNYSIVIAGDVWPANNCTDDFELVKTAWHEFYHQGTIKTIPMLDHEM